MSSERVRFLCQDAASLPEGTVDVAFAFECVHDMPRPVEVLSAVRRTLAPGGSLIVMDEAVADAFAPDGDDLERIMYGFSLFVCLPDGLSSPPSVGTGTVMRPSTLAGLRRGRRLRRVRGPPDRGLRILALLPAVLTPSPTPLAMPWILPPRDPKMPATDERFGALETAGMSGRFRQTLGHACRASR